MRACEACVERLVEPEGWDSRVALQILADGRFEASRQCYEDCQALYLFEPDRLVVRYQLGTSASGTRTVGVVCVED